MTSMHRLTDNISVAAQISVADLDTLAAQGFRSIINNRPDAEAADQPANAELQAAALKAGFIYRHIPVISGDLQQAQVVDFAEALATLPPPVLAFCRTGTRSSMLWALQAKGTADAILDTALSAGYDLSALRPRLGRK